MQFGLYLNCQTDLIESFRRQFAGDLAFEGNRAIIFQADDELPWDKLATCIAATLTYHQRRRSARSKRTED